MFLMLKRMTIWAKDFQIVRRVIVSITVFMMHAKYFRVRSKAATFAFFEPSRSFDVVARRGDSGTPYSFLDFVHASSAAIFTFVAWCIKKYRAAMRAFKSRVASFVVVVSTFASVRAIFCRVLSRIYYRKHLFTYDTFYYVLIQLHLIRARAFSRAAFKRNLSIKRHRDKLRADDANHVFARMNTFLSGDFGHAFNP